MFYTHTFYDSQFSCALWNFTYTNGILVHLSQIKIKCCKDIIGQSLWIWTNTFSLGRCVLESSCIRVIKVISNKWNTSPLHYITICTDFSSSCGTANGVTEFCPSGHAPALKRKYNIKYNFMSTAVTSVNTMHT